MHRFQASQDSWGLEALKSTRSHVNMGPSTLVLWATWGNTQRSTRPLALPSTTITSGRAFNQPEQRICFEGTLVLAKLYYTSRIIWEAIEIKLHENFNRESGYLLSPAWKIIHMIKQQRGCHKHTLPTNPVPDQGTATATAQGDSVPDYSQLNHHPPSQMQIHLSSLLFPPKHTLEQWWLSCHSPCCLTHSTDD